MITRMSYTIGMKLTKYQHACMVIEHDNSSLVIDPGVFSRDFVPPDNVSAIVVTHEHPDHFDVDRVRNMLAQNPSATLYAGSLITKQFASSSVRAVQTGDNISAGAFNLDFYSGIHATIHSEIPAIPNLGVFVNRTLYYPGDSFAIPTDADVEWLALPVSAPWLQISQSIDFARRVDAKHVFPTHDAILSDDGKAIVDRIGANLIGSPYRRIAGAIEL